jgi:hypothetical protein
VTGYFCFDFCDWLFLVEKKLPFVKENFDSSQVKKASSLLGVAEGYIHALHTWKFVTAQPHA